MNFSNDSVASFFKYKMDAISLSQLEKGDIAIYPETGEYVMGGFKTTLEADNVKLDLIIPKDKNNGNFIVFSVLLEQDIQLTVKAKTDVLKEMFRNPHTHLLRRNSMKGYYEVIEPTTDTATGDIIFLKLGKVYANVF